jgi:hypothetical protein
MMSKMQRVLIILVMTTTLWLPMAGIAQAAAWHSPHGGNTSWSLLHPICRNGVDVTIANVEADDPEEAQQLPNESRSFSAYAVALASSAVPQKVDGPLPVQSFNEIPSLGSASVTARFVSTPLRWTDDDTHTDQFTYFYGAGKITWSSLPVGTTVVVLRTGTTNNYFIGSVTNCTV